MSVTKLDRSGRITESIASGRVSGASGLLKVTADSPEVPDSFTDQTIWSRWTKSFFNNNERLANYQQLYFQIPDSGNGT